MQLHETLQRMLKRSKFNRRKRKRLHIGEFQQMGFDATILFIDGSNMDDQIDKCIEVVESFSCHLSGGGMNKTVANHVIAANSGTLTEKDKNEIVEKLKKIDIVIDVCAGDLFDMWNFTEKDWDRYEKWAKEREDKFLNQK